MTVRILLVLLCLSGMTILLFSFSLPYYADNKRKEKLDIEITQSSISENAKMKEDYYNEVDKLKTKKTSLMDLGSGLIIFSLTILLFLRTNKVSDRPTMKRVLSFDKKNLVAASNAVWIAFIPGSFLYYIFRECRGDYPPFADSIGIPLLSTCATVVLGLIPLNIFILITTRKSNFPTLIFITRARYTAKGILWELFWGFFLLVNILAITGFVFDGDHACIVISLFFTFIILSLRAGQINGARKQINIPRTIGE